MKKRLSSWLWFLTLSLGGASGEDSTNAENVVPTRMRPPHIGEPFGGRFSVRQGGAAIEVHRSLNAERAACEAELERAGHPLPLTSRMAWAQAYSSTSWLVAVRGEGEVCRSAVVLDVQPSRAFPGHLLLRGQRVGPSLDPDLADVTLEAVASLAREQPRVLRLSLELFEPDAVRRSAREAILARLGFHKSAEQRSYSRTLVLDLAPDEDLIFSRLHRSARQNIREVQKGPLRLATIEDAALIDRLQVLETETMTRTGGTYAGENWKAVMALSAAHPHLSRLVGLFRTDKSGDEALIGFAWGRGHGTHAEYRAGGSTRVTDIRAAVGYPLLWDLARWAKSNGAQWFDLGGVTPGELGSDDKLGGISDFKRRFSNDVVTVGEEWVLEPHPFRARLARAVHTGITHLPHLPA